MSGNKIGRIYFGRTMPSGAKKVWEHVASVFNGRYPNKYEISVSRKSDKTGDWVKATEIRYEDGLVVPIKGQYLKLSLDEGYAIVGPGVVEEEEEAPFTQPSQGSETAPF